MSHVLPHTKLLLRWLSGDDRSRAEWPPKEVDLRVAANRFSAWSRSTELREPRRTTRSLCRNSLGVRGRRGESRTASAHMASTQPPRADSKKKSGWAAMNHAERADRAPANAPRTALWTALSLANGWRSLSGEQAEPPKLGAAPFFTVQSAERAPRTTAERGAA